MKGHAFQIAISLLAFVLLVAHLMWPGLKIDAITLTLFGMALIPWLGSVFKSLEMPGGWKFEFNGDRFVKAAEDAEASGLLLSEGGFNEGETEPDVEYATLLETYPRLAVLELRIKIEKLLRKLANRSGITDRKASATTLTRQLAKHGVLTGPESVALLGILASLNSVVHGADINRADAEQVLEVGKRLIESLDVRLQSTEAQ
jgi:hypothetical protein